MAQVSFLEFHGEHQVQAIFPRHHYLHPDRVYCSSAPFLSLTWNHPSHSEFFLRIGTILRPQHVSCLFLGTISHSSTLDVIPLLHYSPDVIPLSPCALSVIPFAPRLVAWLRQYLFFWVLGGSAGAFFLLAAPRALIAVLPVNSRSL